MHGRAPSQLLCHLVAQALGAVGVERADVDVHECPAVLVRQLTAKAIDIVVAAVDGDDGGVVNGSA